MTNVKLFGAAWCSACKSLKPIAEKMANVEYVDIDTPEGMELSAKHGIRGLPTMVREDGKVLVGSDMAKVKEFLGA